MITLPRRLRDQFTAAMVVAALASAAALALLAWSVLETRQLAQAQQRAVITGREVTGLLVLTQDYLLHAEQRARSQWQARYALLRRNAALEAADAAPAPDEPFLLGELEALPALFDRLMPEAGAGPQTPFSASRRELLIDELLTAAQAVADHSYERERRLTQQRTISETRLMALAFALVAALSLLFAAGGVLLRRRVLLPITHLQAAMQRLAAGDLTARDANAGLDELGDLSRGFDHMASQLAQRDEALRSSEQLLRLVTDNVPAMIGYWDRDLRNRFANSDYRRWFGKGPEDIRGRHIQELLGPELYAKNKPYMEAALQGRRQDFDRVIPGSDGVTRYSQASYIPDERDGLVHGFFVLVTDVTPRMKAEQALQRALAEKEVLLKEVYHRVKNNLQVVQSLLSLQAGGLGEGPARQALADMAQRVTAMALVHEQLYRSTDLGAVPLQDYVRDLLRQMATGNAPSGAEIAIAQDVEAIHVGVDTAIPLGLLISELVSNAYKHAFPQGRAGRIDVRIGREAGGVRISVGDDGVGLPAQHEPCEARSIGLQLARALARQLGGELHFDGPPGTQAWLLASRCNATSQ